MSTDLVAIRRSLESDLVRARALSEAEMGVGSAAEEVVAAEVMKALHAEVKALEAKRREITDPLNAALKSVSALFQEPLGHLARAKTRVQTALAEYRTRLENEKMALLDAALDSGSSDVQRLSLVAATAPATTLQGVRETTDYEVEVVDASLVPEAFKVVDLMAVRKAVKAAAGQIQIPGVTVRTIKKLSPTGR